MRAFRLIAHGAPGRFELGEVPDPVPSTGEVLVRVAACGLNHLDLWLEEAGLPIALELPRIPGCEIAGVVEQPGPEVSEWHAGDRVAVQSNLFCGTCEFCQKGEESLCLQGSILGVQRDGGFAEKVTVPARALVRLPDAVDFTTSAALTLAGSTAMRMLTSRTQVGPGDWVLVVGGASGVGSAAIQIASGLGAKVVATGSTPAKRDLAMRLGAHLAVDSEDPRWPALVRKATGRRGVDVVIEHVGGTVLRQVFECLARGGTVVTCGATAGRDVQFDLWPFFVKQQRLVGSYGRSRADLQRTLEWVEAGRLRPVIHEVVALERALEAFAALRARRVLGKMVIQP